MKFGQNLKVLNDNKKVIQLLNIELINLNKKLDVFKEKLKNKLIQFKNIITNKYINNNIIKEEKNQEIQKEILKTELNDNFQFEIKKEGKNNSLDLINEVNTKVYKNIQIICFTTNFTDRKPGNIFYDFLKNVNHSMTEKTYNKIKFFVQFRNSAESLKIEIYSIFNFYEQYKGINDVSCYILFIDLDNYDIKEHYKLILDYIKYNCNNKKKLYVLGMFNGNEDKKYIYEEDILKQLYDFGFIYDYIIINISDEKHISEIIMKMLLYCSKHPIISENEIQEKNNKINYPEL